MRRRSDEPGAGGPRDQRGQRARELTGIGAAGTVRAMRILLVSHGYPPGSVGGVEQHVFGLANALALAGHRVHVLARAHRPGRPQGEFAATAVGNPSVTEICYRWEGVGSLAAIYSCEPMAAAVARFVAERAAAGESFDLAHVHHLTGLSVDSVAALRACGLPVVLTLHDYWLFCPRGQMFHHREEACERATVERCAPCLEATFPSWLDAGDRSGIVAAVHARARDVLALADQLVVPSRRAMEPFVDLGVPAERFAVVANGVDVEALRRVPAPAAGPGPLRVGFLGTLLPSKGLHVLLAAMRGLPPGAATLDVHGNAAPYHGDSGYLTRCFSTLRPGDGVRYHGPYGLDELPRILAGIDVLAAPALWHEAFGLTVREALAAGRPVLVSRVGGLADALPDRGAGFVLPPGDVPAWTAALADLAADRSLVRRLAAAGRHLARDFAAMAGELADLYERVRSRASVPRPA